MTHPGSASGVGGEEARELLALCLEVAERSGDAGVEEFLARHPLHAPVLRQRLAKLRDAGLLARPIGDLDLAEGGELGDFRLLRKLGEGGMGVVYLAEQRSLRREVALKVVRPGHLLFPDSRERFRREVEAVARLQHPAIVPVHLVGEERGVPFFAMEHVRGCSLADVMRALRGRAPRELTGRSLAEAIAACAPEAAEQHPHAASGWVFEGSWIDACLRLLQQAADALEHAHRRGVLHRDVKPSNLMVTPAGRVMLLDFGLAATDGSSRITRTGAQLGSLPYLAPEQVRGEVDDLGPRTDVYGLGVTLHELLTLRLPYDGPTADATIARILEGRPAPIRAANPAVPWDAETVCLTAMDREPRRRYASAADFGRDLANALERRPIEARRPGVVLRARRWVQRHPAWTVAGTLGTLVLVGGPLLYAVQEHRYGVQEHKNRVALEASFRRAEGMRLTAASGRALESNPGLGLLLAIEGARREPGLQANQALLAALASCRERRALHAHPGLVYATRFAPDGRSLATAGADCAIFTWDAGTGAESGVLLGHELSIGALQFSPDGSLLISGSDDRTARIWDLASSRCRTVLRGHRDALRAAAFLPDGERAATASADGTARIWDVATGECVAVLAKHRKAIDHLDASRDGLWLATASADGTARIWDARGGAEVAVLKHDAAVKWVRFDPEGTRVVTASADRTARVWSVPSAAVLATFREHAGRVNTAEFDPSGTRVVSAATDRTARVWDPGTGEEVGAPLEHNRGLRRAHWSPDGRLIATCSDDHTVRLFRSDDHRPVSRLEGHGANVISIEFGPDGSRIATAADGARLWDVGEPWVVSPSPPEEGRTRRMAVAPDGLRAADVAEDAVRIRDLATSRALHVLAAESNPQHACYSRDGAHVAVGSTDGKVRIFDASTGRRLAELSSPSDPKSMAFSPDGEVVYAGCFDGIARAWRWREASPPRAYGKKSDVAMGLGVSPDGTRLGLATRDRALRIFDVATGEPVGPPIGGNARALSVCFSPDGRRVLTTGLDGRARVWDLETRAAVATFETDDGDVFDADFSPDGRLVATASGERTARIWSAETGQELARDADYPTNVFGVRFLPDGEHVVAVASQGAARRIPVDPLAEALRRKPRELTVDERIDHGVGDPAVWRAARTALAAARKGKVFVAETVEALEASRELAPEVRAAALELAAGLRDHPQHVAYAAWSLMWAPGRSRAEYELALRYAEVAVRMVPESGDFQRGMGIACFRVGRHAEAAHWLQRPESISELESPDDHAITLGFLARALEESGRCDEAAAARARCDAALRKTPSAIGRFRACLPELATPRN